MKVLLINGSPNEKGCTYTALHEVEKTLNKQNIDTEIFHIGKAPISGCLACFKCLADEKCIIKDSVRDIQEKMETIDAIIIGSPVYYSGITGPLVSFLNRLFLHKDRMSGKLGAAVVSCRRGGASSTFDQINKYFTVCSMPVVSSQYWNQVHGTSPEEVLKDLEGLQTMRTLGENMAWLLSCIDIGRKNGIDKPKYEKSISTNFIR